MVDAPRRSRGLLSDRKRGAEAPLKKRLRNLKYLLTITRPNSCHAGVRRRRDLPDLPGSSAPRSRPEAQRFQKGTCTKPLSIELVLIPDPLRERVSLYFIFHVGVVLHEIHCFDESFLDCFYVSSGEITDKRHPKSQ